MSFSVSQLNRELVEKFVLALDGESGWRILSLVVSCDADDDSFFSFRKLPEP